MTTEWMEWMSHRRWKETKQQPGTAGPSNMLGCCFVSFHFLWPIVWPHPVVLKGTRGVKFMETFLFLLKWIILQYSYMPKKFTYPGGQISMNFHLPWGVWAPVEDINSQFNHVL